MKETLFVNLFAGPGAGKSTTAAGLFYKLKTNHFNAELIQEYAKDKVWAEDFKTLSFQPYILGKQLYRQFRVMNQVDVAVTDSPVLLSHIYQGFGWVDGADDVLLKQFNLFKNLNIMLVRDTIAHPYNPKGRTQTENEAKDLDFKILNMMKYFDLKFHSVVVSKDGAHIDEILDLVKQNV